VTHDAHAMHPPTSTGLDSRKLAIWIFIGSECLFFASLISTYVIYRGQDAARALGAYAGKTPANTLEISLVTFGTALLLFSSFFVVLALNGLQRARRGQFLTFLGLTILCGLFFVGMQVYEFTHFVREGLTIHTNLFGSSFFTLTGFHGTHVSVGVLWLTTLFILGLRGKLPPEKALNLEIAALYWHFVDVVWIVIFPVVYLMK
jgi:heme/copper-type cytochrome/quinol oxidase subunit 3